MRGDGTQNDIEKLGKGAENNRMKFNGKLQKEKKLNFIGVLQEEKKHLIHGYKMKNNWPGK